MTKTEYDEVITYDKIVEASKIVDKSKQNKVVLSPYRAWLFRKILKLICKPNDNQPVLSFEILMLCFMSLLILITSPKLMFLAYFYDVGEGSFERVIFEKNHNKTLVIFNPK